MSNISDEKNVKVFMKVAAAVIMKEGDNGEKLVLLIQRAADDHWPLHYEFPRGKCDKPIGEPIIKCLKREVKEETGLSITPIKFIDKFEYLADRGTRKTVCYNYLCKMDDPNAKIKLSKEHDDYKWISQVGEAELLVMPEQKDTIEKVLNPGRTITVDPENSFTKNNQIEEYLNYLNESGYELFGSHVLARWATIGAIALSVKAISASYKVYKKKKSGAVDACKNRIDKDICLDKFKIAAKKEQIRMLEKAKKFCDKTNDPPKCKQKIKEKIENIKRKIKK